MKTTAMIAALVAVFLFSGVSISEAAPASDKERVCKIECNKVKSVGQQACSDVFHDPKSKGYKNVATLVACVQSVSERTEACVKECLNPKKKLEYIKYTK